MDLTSDTRIVLRGQVKSLTAIGIALSAEKDIDKLLEMIISEAIDFSRADGGTLYLVEPDGKALRFAIVMNKTLGTSIGGKAGAIDWPPVPLEKDGKPYTPNFTKVADAFGCRAERVTKAEQIRPALKRALKSRKPAVVEVMVNRQYPHSGSPAVGWWDVPVPTYLKARRKEYEKGHSEEVLQ